MTSSGAFDHLVGASVDYRIAVGPNASRKVLALRTVSAQPAPGFEPMVHQHAGSNRLIATC
jgi:hypothetical protein